MQEGTLDALALDELPAEGRRREWDWWLIGAASALVSLGLLMILSASNVRADQDYGNSLHFVTRQFMGLAGGLALGFGVIQLSWEGLNRAAWPFYLVVTGMLALVLSPLGVQVNGATRWIRLGFINVQPSELAKLALIMMLSRYLAANEGRLRDFGGVGIPGLSLLLPISLLILGQKDFGTIVLLISLTGVLFFVAGLDPRWLFGLAGLSVFPLAILIYVEPFRVQRIVSFLDPFEDRMGHGYQVIQGWIALASGGWTGVGLVSGLAQQGFLPEAHTDFISAVIAEELGLVGFLGILFLYGIVVWRGTLIASRAPDLFGMLSAVGITALLAAQVIINVGVVVGLLPAKGLVLPLLSYGATAILVHVLCIAILVRIGLEAEPVAQET